MKMLLLAMIAWTLTLATCYGQVEGVAKGTNEARILIYQLRQEAAERAAQAAEERRTVKKPEADPYRQWNDKSGKQLFTAKFLEFKSDGLRLKLKDSSEVKKISMNDLSKEDQKWVRDEQKSRKEKAKYEKAIKAKKPLR